jgi:flagellin-like hook-associated protein FlgL
MRDGLGVVEVAEAAYNDVLNILDKMQNKVVNAQTAEDLNTALSSDSTSLAAAFSSYNTEITSVVTNRQFNSQNLIDGTFTNQVFPLWSGETNSPSISLEDIEDTMSSHRTFSALYDEKAVASDVESDDNAVFKSSALCALVTLFCILSKIFKNILATYWRLHDFAYKNNRPFSWLYR